MLLAPLAVSLILTVPAGADDGAQIISTIFETYCHVNDDTGTKHPYCKNKPPDGIKWLVLTSLCSQSPMPAGYGDVCARLIEATPAIEYHFLAYNPTRDTWSPLKSSVKSGSDGKNEAALESWTTSDVNVDETGLATITKAPKEDVGIIVLGVNPLLYVATPDSVSSEDIESLASLQALTMGIGTALQGYLGVVGHGTLGVSPGGHLAAPPPPSPLDGAVTAYSDALKAFAEASIEASKAASAIDISRVRATAAIQEMEVLVARAGSYALTVTPQSRWPDALDAFALDNALNNLDDKYRAASDFGGRCGALVKDFRAALEDELSEEEFGDRLVGFRDKWKGVPPCTPAAMEFLATAIRDDVSTFCTAALPNGETPCPGGTPAANQALGDWLDEARGADVKGLDKLFVVPEKPKEPGSVAPFDAAVTALTTERAAGIKPHHYLVSATDRRNDYLFGDGRLMTWLYIPPKTDQLPWDKVQTHSFSVKPSAPLGDQVAADHPDENKLSYKLKSRRGAGVGVGVGVIYTPLTRPTFDAVTNPNNSAEKNAAQTDTTAIAGQLAIFADWRLLSLLSSKTEGWHVRPSLQIGSNASSTAGFFLGGSFDIFKAVRLGVGETWQQNKRLVTDPSAPIASKDDIQTADRFDRRYYVSLAFALDSLPLFKNDNAKAASGSGSQTTDDASAGGDKAKDDGGSGDANQTAAAKGKKKTGGK